MAKKHKHKWIPYILGSQVCALCGINRASTGYKYDKNGEKYVLTSQYGKKRRRRNYTI
jgi:hypothetical protein